MEDVKLDEQKSLIKKPADIIIQVQTNEDEINSVNKISPSNDINNANTNTNKSDATTSTKDERAFSTFWGGRKKAIDSRLLLFSVQIMFSAIAVGFGMYLVIDHKNNEGYLSLGSSLIMYILGFLTKSPVAKRRDN